MTKQEQLKNLYNQARKAGICFTQKEFASLLGVSVTNLSSAMNGDEKYLTENLFFKIEKLFQDNNIQYVTDNHGTIVNEQKNFAQTDEAWFALVAEKDKQINRLLTIIEKITESN